MKRPDFRHIQELGETSRAGGGCVPDQLYKTETVLEAILSSIDESIHVIDTEGKTIYYNEAAARLDGLTKEEVIGRHLLQSFPSLSHKDSTLLRVIRDGQAIINKNQTYITAHGKRRETVNTTLPIFVEDRQIGAIEVAKDYTKLKLLSERLLDLEQSIRLKKKGQIGRPAAGKMYSFGDLITEDPDFLNIIAQGRKAAASHSSVLVYGESGTGKELFVQSIHSHSPRIWHSKRKLYGSA